MTSRALSFGEVAECYDRFRLGYPAAVADLVLGYAAPPVTLALEVGAGTGKATRLFAGRGLEIIAAEPDAAMLAVLERHTRELSVTPVRARFEQLTLVEPVDLLYAAAAWHWTDPALRWTQAAALLRSGGTFASFGSGGTVRTLLADPALQEAVDEAKRGLMTEPPFTSEERGPNGLFWPASELAERLDFTDVEEYDIARQVERSQEEFLGQISTMSAYLQLSGTDRAEVLRRIGAALPPTVRVRSDLRVHLARRA